MTHLALNGNTVVLALSFIVLSIILSIVGLRFYWRCKLRNSVSRSDNSPLKNTGVLHAFAICLALLTANTLMSWTKMERAVFSYNPDRIAYEDVIVIPPTTHVTRKPKPIPPAPNPTIKEVDNLVEIKNPDEIPLEVPVDAEAQTSDVPSYLAQPTPPAPKVKKPEEKILKVVKIVSIAEQMPRFPGCYKDDLTNAEQTRCTESELMKYVYDNLEYPRVARENSITGRVIIQFVIDTKGDISDVKVVRDIGGGCGAAASKVIQDMVGKKGLWTPGKQSHRKVKVRYTLPITFALD